RRLRATLTRQTPPPLPTTPTSPSQKNNSEIVLDMESQLGGVIRLRVSSTVMNYSAAPSPRTKRNGSLSAATCVGMLQAMPSGAAPSPLGFGSLGPGTVAVPSTYSRSSS